MASPGGDDGAQEQEAGFHFPGSSTSTSTSSSRDTATAERSNCQAMEPKNLTLTLLEKITNNFSKERLLGHGAYGKVYKGVHDGREIAVKLLNNNMQTIDDEQFIHGFSNLMMLNHPNTIQLVGYCYETRREHMDFNGKIVFDECNGLDWQTRYKIIKGACEGLKYLHEGFEKPFYHLDLKPDNILLDKNMVPKLADIGFGYMPPEYLFGNLVSNKLDIFSLGVAMTKIIAGHNGHDELLDQVQGNWRKRLQTTWSSPEPLEAQCQQVKRCSEIALSCMETDRHKRPSIVDIIHELNQTEKIMEKVTSYYEQELSPPPSNSNVPSPLPIPIASYIGSSTPRWRPPPVTSSVMLPPPTPPPPSGGLMKFFRMFIQRKPKMKGHSGWFTYQELADATRDFADTRRLGQGAFGVVYKGAVMVQDKEVDVAIKTILVVSDEARAAFKNEVEIMSPLNHRNIIRLVGSCDEKDNLLLVYELVQNCNLQAQLYNHGGLVLDWRQRDFNPKLCDFGLVTQLTHAATSRSTNNLIGTQGYMDPSFEQYGNVTTHSDAYSFGVLLLEVVCGVAPILIGNPLRNSLIENVQECHGRSAILDAADKRLRGKYDEEIKGMLLIGIHCVETRRSDRPTIRIVLS
ncbi:hypothetical protein VPH35_041555 [Triticum aestivum]